MRLLGMDEVQASNAAQILGSVGAHHMIHYRASRLGGRGSLVTVPDVI